MALRDSRRITQVGRSNSRQLLQKGAWMHPKAEEQFDKHAAIAVEIIVLLGLVATLVVLLLTHGCRG